MTNFNPWEIKYPNRLHLDSERLADHAFWQTGLYFHEITTKIFQFSDIQRHLINTLWENKDLKC